MFELWFIPLLSRYLSNHFLFLTKVQTSPSPRNRSSGVGSHYCMHLLVHLERKIHMKLVFSERIVYQQSPNENIQLEVFAVVISGS